MKYSKSEIAESKAALLEWLKPGMTVYTILDSCSRSGMCRHIRLVVLEGDSPRYLSYHAAKVLGYKCDRHSDAIRITGCGMDMGFALVYELSSALFARDEANPHKSGGYALSQRWL
jgi:hypothetical protein